MKYLVTCVYKETQSVKFGGKTYDFISEKEEVKGTLVVANDRYGYSLVRVVDCRQCSDLEANQDFYKPIVNLEEINKRIVDTQTKKKLQQEIAGEMLQQIQDKAFESLCNTNPALAEKIKQYRDLGGDYTQLLPSITNISVLQLEGPEL